MPARARIRAGMTPEDIRAAAAALGRLGARKGGLARAARLDAEERSRQARHAVGIRWARHRAKRRRRPRDKPRRPR